MRIFYFDAHIGTHGELMYVLKKIYGDSAEIEGWLISGHSFLLNRQPDQPDVINANTWRAINEGLIDGFWEKYKDYLNTFDLFIVAYPAVFSMLYAKTNKPILIYNCVRYDMPFCWSKDVHSLNQFNSYLSTLHQENGFPSSATTWLIMIIFKPVRTVSPVFSCQPLVPMPICIGVRQQEMD